MQHSRYIASLLGCSENGTPTVPLCGVEAHVYVAAMLWGTGRWDCRGTVLHCLGLLGSGTLAVHMKHIGAMGNGTPMVH